MKNKNRIKKPQIVRFCLIENMKSGSIKKKSKMIEKKNSFEVKYLLFSSDIENFQEAFFFLDNLFKKLHSSRVSKKSGGGPVMVESSYELHPACSMRTRKFMLTSKSY